MGGLVTERVRDRRIFYKTGHLRRFRNTSAPASCKYAGPQARP